MSYSLVAKLKDDKRIYDVTYDTMGNHCIYDESFNLILDWCEEWDEGYWGVYDKLPYDESFTEEEYQFVWPCIKHEMFEESNKVWIGRSKAKIPEDAIGACERHPERRIVYTKLFVFYDRPYFDDKSGLWFSRTMAEAPSYMFPYIKEGECREFTDMTNLRELFCNG
jgi:hypothetical protein